MIVVVMGIAGSGKTAVGRAVAEARGCDFLDADDLHTNEARAAMRAGRALTEAERGPWLSRLRTVIAAHPSDLVVACSALSRASRDVLRGAGPDVRLVHLRVGREELSRRLGARTGHFFPASLLDSQLAAFEPIGANESVLEVDAEAPLEEVCARVGALVTRRT